MPVSTLGMTDSVNIALERGSFEGYMVNWDFENRENRILTVFNTLERAKIISGIWDDNAYVKVTVTKVFN